MVLQSYCVAVSVLGCQCHRMASPKWTWFWERTSLLVGGQVCVSSAIMIGLILKVDSLRLCSFRCFHNHSKDANNNAKQFTTLF